MRIKKGFTLAEVLIVLMVIGAIATMTIPSLMKGVTETQWKTSYKKAYNAVINLCAMERISGALPSTADSAGISKMFESLNANLSVKDYADASATAIDSGTVVLTKDLKNGVTFTDSNGSTVNTGTNQATFGNNMSAWITSDDGISYAVVNGTGCGTKQQIDGAENITDVLQNSCVVVVVDVNGLTKGPNILEPQQTDGITSTATLGTLTGDRYYIFVGRDGATAGPKGVTVTGRIAGDLK